MPEKQASKQQASRLEAAKTFIVFTIIGGIAFVVSLFFDFSLCPIYNITGIPCFSCGMTRAVKSLPDIRQAFFYHPLFFILILIPPMAFLSEEKRNKIYIAMAVLLVGVWIIRMIIMFPHTPPMNYNSNSLFEFIRRLFS